jgi:hypothetical protein
VDLSIRVDPTLLRFGQVNVGTSTTLLVGYQNTGTKSYHITGATLFTPTPFFAIAEITAQELKPDQSLQVSVTFSPGQQGNFNATLNLVSEEGGIPPVTVQGAGVFPTTEETPADTPSPTPKP